MNSEDLPEGPLAQLVEQLAFNQLVEGSNPSRPTTYKLVVKRYKIKYYLNGDNTTSAFSAIIF